MQVYIDGNVIKASLITGPDHHFLGIEFCKVAGSVNFFDLSNSSTEELNRRKEFLEKIIFDEEGNSLATPSGLYIKSVLFDLRDSSNEFAYSKLLHLISDNLSEIAIC